MKKALSIFAAVTALATAQPAIAADVLLDLADSPKQSVTPESFTFVATGSSSTINFQGYNLPGTTSVVNIFLGLSGSPATTANNLLGGLAFTGTPSGCSAAFNTFGNGSTSNVTGARDLNFGGTCAGLYDTLSQTVNTASGSSYTLSFLFSNSATGSNGLRVSTGVLAAAAVPEPASWAMMLLGLTFVGFTIGRRRMALTPAI